MPEPTGPMRTRKFVILSQQMYAQIGFKWDPNRGEYLDSKYGIRVVSKVKEVGDDGQQFGEEYELNSVVAYPYTSRVEKEQIFHPSRSKVEEAAEALLRGDLQGFDVDDVSDFRSLYEADKKGTIRILTGLFSHLIYDMKPTRDWKPKIEESLKLVSGDQFIMQVPEGKKPHFIPLDILLKIGKGVASKKKDHKDAALPAEEKAEPMGSMSDIPGFEKIKPLGKGKGKKKSEGVEIEG